MWPTFVGLGRDGTWGPFLESPYQLIKKRSSLLARTSALILYISIGILDFGPEKLPGLSRNGPLSPVRAHSLWAGVCPEKLVKKKKNITKRKVTQNIWLGKFKAKSFLSDASQPGVMPFPLIIIWPDTTKFALLSVFILVETTWPKIRSKPLPMNDIRDSKASL